ncbi:hypothetical protein POSPLADRAFT_1037608 [Postia placenta MAD-698-R-SB12]|uniref:Uncharacterized protein n=1 Tax=Postia placenta MAD-698-R-SB12 TaxID=670580 RepID=A0A1X6MIU9_9APHY|nr:hypothetical protein POSPLADRAFT_1037608 [Postia placenta MAD-698-R-SB12]OSX56334.1 hypothetical protein POSPLADRAFT_1037608 [Postia placenta MAD-698-R-SB12]
MWINLSHINKCHKVPVSSGSIPARLLPGAPSQPQNFHLEQRVTDAAGNVPYDAISDRRPLQVPHGTAQVGVENVFRTNHANFISGNEAPKRGQQDLTRISSILATAHAAVQPPSQSTQPLSQSLLHEDNTPISAQGVRHVEPRQRLSLFEPQMVDFSVDGLNPENGFPMDVIYESLLARMMRDSNTPIAPLLRPCSGAHTPKFNSSGRFTCPTWPPDTLSRSAYWDYQAVGIVALLERQHEDHLLLPSDMQDAATSPGTGGVV